MNNYLKRKARAVTSAQRQFQQEVLQAHNTYRVRHCVSALHLDGNLTIRAQSYAEYLASIDRMVHSNGNDIGENLYMQWGSGNIRGKDATDLWYNEVKKYNFNQAAFTWEAGHFTQLVWKGSQKLGIGTATSKKDNTYVVTQYSPPGNISGKFQSNVLPAQC